MKDEALLQLLKESLRQSAGWEGDEIAADRQRALDYYYGRPTGDEITGRSHAVSNDVSAMVEANLAQMLDAFSSSNIVEFQSFGPEDEDQAQLESDTISYYVMEKNNGFQELAQAIKGALLLRNGFVKVWTEERRYPKLERYANATAEAVSELINRPGVEAKVMKYDPETGELRLRTVYVNKRFRVESVAPENFFYLKNWHSFDLQEIPFCAERHVDRRSDLVELGFPKSKVKELKAYTSDITTASSRNVGGVQAVHPQSEDPSQDTIEWFECYVMYDSDGDHISERHRVCFSDETILEDEEVNLVPYAAGAVMINPHRLTGISLWDKLRQVQDLNTGLTRALMDNINANTLNRVVVLDGVVNPDDLANGSVNKAVRAKMKAGITAANQAVMPIPTVDLTGGILANIQHMKQTRSEMGGAALDMQQAQTQLGDIRGSQGVDRAYSVMEQLAAMMTKNIADTLIKHTFLLAHATMRDSFDELSPIKRNGKWYAPQPSQWPSRSCIYVKVGMSPGERTRKVNALREIVSTQMQLTQMGLAGGVMLNADSLYKSVTDWARVAEIPNPEQYFIDPQTPQSQQAQAQAAQAAQADKQKQETLVQQAVALEQLRTAFEKYKADAELQFKYWNKTQDVQVEEAKLAGSATIELIKLGEAANDADEGTEDSASKSD